MMLLAGAIVQCTLIVLLSGTMSQLLLWIFDTQGSFVPEQMTEGQKIKGYNIY